MKNKKNPILMAMVLSVVVLTACANDNKKIPKPTNQIEEGNQIEDSLNEDDKVNTATKIEGRRKEFLERLDNIQLELDSLPEKKDSDAGVTNAMKSYYGMAYEMYDKELNEIYALLKDELSPEIMEDLKTKQIKWIEEKEEKADKEEATYEGGTLQFVAPYVSLYQSTKERCYELVNEYMTDDL